MLNNNQSKKKTDMKLRGGCVGRVCWGELEMGDRTGWTESHFSVCMFEIAKNKAKERKKKVSLKKGEGRGG